MHVDPRVTGCRFDGTCDVPEPERGDQVNLSCRRCGDKVSVLDGYPKSERWAEEFSEAHEHGPCRACQEYRGKTIRHRALKNCPYRAYFPSGTRVSWSNLLGRRQTGTVLWCAKTGNVMVEFDNVTNIWDEPFKSFIYFRSLETM